MWKQSWSHKNRGHVLFSRANSEQELKLNFWRHCKMPQMVFFDISVFPEQNIQKLAEVLQANKLNTAPELFLLKTISNYCCKNVSWKEFKYKASMETFFPGRICYLHFQAPVWPNSKTFPGSQFCREPLNGFARNCDPESPGIASCKDPDSQVLQG